MKKYLLGIVTFVLLPLTALIIVGGMMQGRWFDGENLLARTDTEIYYIPCWQYCAYYATCLLLFVWECFAFRQFIRLAANGKFLYWGLFLVIMTFFLLLVFSIYL